MRLMEVKLRNRSSSGVNVTPVRSDLRRFSASDGLEYRIDQYQTAQVFLLFALFPGKALQQPVVLLLADFFLFHGLEAFVSRRVGRTGPRRDRIVPAGMSESGLPAGRTADSKKPAQALARGCCRSAIAGGWELWHRLVLGFCIGLDRIEVLVASRTDSSGKPVWLFVWFNQFLLVRARTAIDTNPMNPVCSPEQRYARVFEQ
jgi:hypothetical protein